MGPNLLESAQRRRAAVVAGHTGDAATAERLLTDADAVVRATALGALGRLGLLSADPGGPLAIAAEDGDAAVRRRAAREAARVLGAAVVLVRLLDDAEPSVVEEAAWALGEHEAAAGPDAVARLAAIATAHHDALCREAAVAALGAIGDDAGLPAILHGTTDKPAIRRRAVLALAPFDGPDVDEALQRALSDRDWQVRQAAEDLLAD